MALRTIRLGDDELLRKKSKLVKEITPKVKILLDDMAETMYEKDGLGLAAPQVGVLRRVVIIDIGEEGGGLIELINPVVIKMEGLQHHSEGCLSLPGKAGIVDRPESVEVKALDRDGNEIIIQGEGLLAVALCHEIDHLDGVLFTDKVIEYDDEEEYDDEYDEEEETGGVVQS